MGVTNVVLAPRDLERGAGGGNVLLFHNNIYPYPALKLSAGVTGVTEETKNRGDRGQRGPPLAAFVYVALHPHVERLCISARECVLRGGDRGTSSYRVV